MDQGASVSSKNHDDAAAQGRLGSGSEQQGASSNPDGDRQRRRCGSEESQIRKHGSGAARACRTSRRRDSKEVPSDQQQHNTSKQSTREKT